VLAKQFEFLSQAQHSQQHKNSKMAGTFFRDKFQQHHQLLELKVALQLSPMAVDFAPKNRQRLPVQPGTNRKRRRLAV
jgi:hypothetical protein